MKWKNNIVIFSSCLIVFISAHTLEKAQNKVVEGLIDCRSVCSRTDDKASSSLKRRMCTCPDGLKDSSEEHIQNEKFPEVSEETTAKIVISKSINDPRNESIYLVKRDTIRELIEKRSKSNNNLPKTLLMLSTEKPTMMFNVKNFNSKFKITPKPTGLFSDNKHVARNKDLETRLENFKSRMSLKPLLVSRNSFTENDRPTKIMKQLQEHREKIVNNFKSMQSKALLGKDTNLEHVGNVQNNPNQIQTLGDKIKNKLRQKEEERKQEKESDNEAEIVETVDVISQKPLTELPRSTTETIVSSIQIEQKEINEVASTDSPIKTETVSALDKIKEKQKETVIKIKDRLSGKYRSKKIEIVDEDE